ncbi:MAG TPA: WYL domain-containing protein, partial [Nevskiaceae bacterium]|nr:WYL domain-containing protein [Nevskiaceae bacterium]
SRADRLFQLHRLLAGRRTALPLQRIQEELGCSRATAVRLITQLRDQLGAPLHYDREQGGYRYEGEALHELPGLWLSAEEVAALLTLDALAQREPSGLLARGLAPFRQRLEQLLPVAAGSDWRQRLRVIASQGRDPGPGFGPVCEALVARQRLRVRYRGRGRGETDPAPRELSPQRLTLYRDRWYLDAWCHQREGLRTFAVERLSAIDRLETAALDLPQARLDPELGASYGIFAGAPVAWAELEFSARAAEWLAEENWHPQQQDQRLADGRLRRRLPYSREEELLMDLLRQVPEVQVLAPASLRDALRERLQAGLVRLQGSGCL